MAFLAAIGSSPRALRPTKTVVTDRRGRRSLEWKDEEGRSFSSVLDEAETCPSCKLLLTVCSCARSHADHGAHDGADAAGTVEEDGAAGWPWPFELRDVEGKGRAAFATRSLPAGELILRERALLWAALGTPSGLSADRCNVCGHRAIVDPAVAADGGAGAGGGLACPDGCGVRWCSAACQAEGWRRHASICGALRRVASAAAESSVATELLTAGNWQSSHHHHRHRHRHRLANATTDQHQPLQPHHSSAPAPRRAGGGAGARGRGGRGHRCRRWHLLSLASRCHRRPRAVCDGG